VAGRIKAHLREADTVARLGGDEFVILLETITHLEQIAYLAEAIIRTLSEPFILCQTHQVTIGASIGISVYPQHGNSGEELIDNADIALYQAKNSGRGCFAYFS
jgi:diguanylate cyclase (GGDEF)-like protein